MTVLTAISFVAAHKLVIKNETTTGWKLVRKQLFAFHRMIFITKTRIESEITPMLRCANIFIKFFVRNSAQASAICPMLNTDGQ